MKALKRGSVGKDVRRVQKKVGVIADGVFGRKTEAAVKTWQRSHKLKADGIVGVLTWSKMFPIRSIFRRPADIIVLDIGHGMGNVKAGRYDSGAVGGGVHEHKRAKQLVAELKKQLEARGRVVRIVADIAVSKRDDAAARFKPYLFASNHLNAGGGQGVEVLVAKGAGARIKRIAGKIAAAIAGAAGLKNRGVKVDVRGLAIFRLMPQKTVLIEWAFVDSKSDRAKLADHEKQAVVAVAEVLDAA